MKVNSMFCYQCEQTAYGTGCTMRGVCGKTPEVAAAQDVLAEALVWLAVTKKEMGGPLLPKQARAFTEGLFSCITNVNFDSQTICRLSRAVRGEGKPTAYGVTCRQFAMEGLWKEPENIRSLKSLLLFGLRGMAAYAHHAAGLGYRDREVDAFFVLGLAAIAEDRSAEDLLDLVLKLGKVNYTCMALLDKAHATTYGTPSPVRVTMAVEPGPFIVVTGHDLRDLKQLLEQTERKGVNVYTHGEMLPAHGYPGLRQHRHLKGNYGTAWQNQQKEFRELPAPVLWTTNCLMPPLLDYAGRVWTTGPVHYAGTRHIDEVDGRKDFSELIRQAQTLGGWPERKVFTGINGGKTLLTGCGYKSILSLANQIVGAVRRGTIRHFLLVGGCDGARPGRNYYTELVRQAPKDWMILTLACGKYRFNDLDLGTIEGFPRLLDLGQCNDAYGAIQVVLGLAKALGCGINDLPLSIVLSWYEQKAVVVLLTLLALDIRDIRLGPTLPAFVSSGVLRTLQVRYGLRPTTTPEGDLAEMANKGMSE